MAGGSEERVLVERAAAGEASAFDRLARRHRPDVVRTARHVLGDAELAEDIAQDALLRLRTALPGFRGDAALGTWLYRVTLNLCRDQLRRRRVSRIDDPAVRRELPASDASDPGARLDTARLREAVRASIDRLPEEQRRAGSLRFLADLTSDQIARAPGVPRGTVASRVFRGLRRIGEDIDARHLELMP